MINPFAILLPVIITLILLVPFGLSALYLFLSWRQWSIAHKEKSNTKKKGSLRALLVSLVILILTIITWLWLMYKMYLI